MSTKEQKIEIFKRQIDSANELAELARKVNNKRSLNKLKKIIKQAEKDLARLNVN